MTIAWADGHFDDEEKDLIATITDDELAPSISFDSFEPIAPRELARALGNDDHTTENFLRTAVMVAVADGVYSASEDQKLHDFCEALDLDEAILQSLRSTLHDDSALAPTAPSEGPGVPKVDPLRPAREWLDQLDVQDPRLARFLCKMIPPQCPFERDVKLFGRKVVHIPAMCKLNPLYDQLVGLRFRSLSYLADECGEDISEYI